MPNAAVSKYWYDWFWQIQPVLSNTKNYNTFPEFPTFCFNRHIKRHRYIIIYAWKENYINSTLQSLSILVDRLLQRRGGFKTLGPHLVVWVLQYPSPVGTRTHVTARSPLGSLKHLRRSTWGATKLVDCKCSFFTGCSCTSFLSFGWHSNTPSCTQASPFLFSHSCQEARQPRGENLHPATAQRHASQQDSVPSRLCCLLPSPKKK